MVAPMTNIALRVLAELNARDLLPIVRDVCRVHGVTLEEVCGTLRSQSVVRARHEAWWRVRSYPERHYSNSDVARIFARSTTTIQWGLQAQARRLAAHSVAELSRD
jgi:chromosomal replication initiation ATPase DnaA